MKKYSLFILFLFGIIHSFAQQNLEWISKDSKELILKGKECWKEQGENCLTYFQKAFTQSKKDKICIPCTELLLALQHYKMSNPDSAYYHLEEVTKLTEKEKPNLRDEVNLVAYNLMGVLESTGGNNEKAIKTYLKASEIADRLGKKEQASATNFNIGMIYFEQSNYEQAIKVFKNVFREFQKINAKHYYSVVSGNIAGAFMGLEKADSSDIWARKSINYAKENDDPFYLDYGYYVLANSFFSKKQSDSSFYYANLGVKTSRENEDFDNLHKNLSILAQNQMENGEFKNAIKNYTEALDLIENKVKIHTRLNPLYKDLGIAYMKMGDYKNSALYYEKYVNLNETMASEESQRMVHELNTKYETEKKEKQIAEQELKIQKQRANLLYAILGGALLVSILGGIFLYNRKTQRIKLKQLQQEKENAILNSFIQGEERERNRISYELHDGVAAMIGAAKMSLETIPHLPPEKQIEQLSKVKEILENTHADVRHIAHNLLPTVLEKEGIIKATRQFVSEINQTQLIHISVVDNHSKAEDLSRQLQLMLFRIIQELINNTIKHSQAQNAVINFTRQQNELQIEVSDDGIGYDGEVDSGNQGLYSISQRLKSIGGNFKFIKKNDRGMQAIAELKV